MSTLFPIYSISKPFLAQAVLELKLPLGDEIGQYLQGLDPVYASRTLHSLLNHTAGLADYSFLKDYGQAVDAREPAWGREDLLERCLVFPHNHDGFQYSNIGYLLLRMLVERHTGSSYFDALDKLVFKPLGISGLTEWESTSDLVPDYDPRWVYSGTFVADDRSIKDAISKLAKYRSETIGLAAGLAAVPYANTGFDKPAYSYGFMTDLEAGFVGHGGGGPGFAHMILVETKNFKCELETSTSDFNQTEAIVRLRKTLSN